MHTQRQLICSNGCRQTCKQLIICYKEILSQHTFNITIILAIHKSATKFCHPYPRPIELTNQQLTLRQFKWHLPAVKVPVWRFITKKGGGGRVCKSRNKAAQVMIISRDERVKYLNIYIVQASNQQRKDGTWNTMW